MGVAGSESGVRGRVVALDAQTGRELWRFNTIPMGKETGAETWQRAGTAKTGGGGVWGAMSLDVTTGELFVPVGNPWPDIDKAYRPGANLFTNSIVALDARTGALRWWYQVSPGDWMDLDMVAPPVMYRGEGTQDLLVFGGKDGYVTAVDRDTRKSVFRTPVTTVITPPKDPPVAGAKMCPGYAGGVEWNGPALDRQNNQLITGAVDVCFNVKLGKAKYKAAEKERDKKEEELQKQTEEALHRLAHEREAEVAAGADGADVVHLVAGAHQMLQHARRERQRSVDTLLRSLREATQLLRRGES
jgi:glucose dehydrogenase